MNEYGFLDINGMFGALWYEEGGDITIFVPHHQWQKLSTTSLQGWQRIGSPKDQNPALKDYAPEIHAAVQAAKQTSTYIDMRTLKRLIRPRGHYHPRAWRGIPPKIVIDGYNGLTLDEADKRIQTESTHSAASLFEELSALFKTVSPSSTNDAAYGPRIRELLILACTESEASWRGIYTANSSFPKKSYGTKDYIKLKPLLRLDEWAVRLKNYPDYPEVNPFKDWNDAQPTGSLPWYGDYNATKHNRENELHRASMGSVIKAMAAVHVLQAAQWGPEIHNRFHGNKYSAFETIKTPEYGPEEQYLKSYGKELVAKKVPFLG